MEADQRIRVAVRIRPALERERYDTTCARKHDDGQSVSMTNENHETNGFNFDFAFDESDDQRAIYEEAAQELVDCTLQGSNSTIFAYGQTGSGKTFTILGKMSSDGSLCGDSGIFLRVFGDLFEYKRQVAARKHILITLSAVELYVEDVMDLLANKAKIRLREVGDETLMPGLNMVEVHEMRDVMRQFTIANSFRSVTATKMNDASSRSHALFLIDVFQMDIEVLPSVKAAVRIAASAPLLAASLVDENGMARNIPGVTKSRLALVDLAGSERVKRSGVEGQGMIEAQAINKSLSTLGTVINAMYLQSSHVPFRESKLTKILKTSFIDKASRLLLIGQVAPATESLSESLGTLRFCDRVKNLKVGSVSQFANPEEEIAYLAALKNNEALCTDIRLAQFQFYYTIQRPRFMAQWRQMPTDQYIKNIMPSLQATATEKERVIEDEFLKDARVAAQSDRDEAVAAFQNKLRFFQQELADVEKQIRSESKDVKVHKEQLEASTQDKMTEAKKLKKQRLTAEDRVAQLKKTLGDVEADLLMVKRKLSIVIGTDSPHKTSSTAVAAPVTTLSSSPRVSKVEKKTRKNSDKGSGGHGFDEDDESTEQGEGGAASSKLKSSDDKRKKKSSNAFDEESDDESPRTEPVGNGGNPSSSSTPPPASTTPARPSVDAAPATLADIANDTEWKAFEFDWQQAEANHEVVSDFYFHVKNVHPLHMDYVHLLTENWKLWGSANKVRFRCTDILQSSTLIPDIIAFVVERAVLISEGTILPNETYAWFDIDGLSVKLKSPFELIPPLLTEAAREPIPIGFVDAHTQTFVDDTEDEPDDDKTIAMVTANRQQLQGRESAVTAGSTKEARERRRKMKGNGATKKYDTEEADRQYLMTVYDSCTLVHDVTKYLRAGTIMVKHGRSGKPHNRLFWVTTVSFRMELVWVDPANRNGDRSCINLNDVGYIALGCFSRVFRRHPFEQTDKEFFLCFTVGLKDGGRTVDIVAGSLPDFEAWVLGLSHLARLDPHWGKPLDISPFPESKQLSPTEQHLCSQQYIFPADYLKVKEKVVKLREEVQMHLRLFANDQEQAYAALGGIHVPQVNDRGAVLMTKGELRFHCSPYSIDIFRVCKIWLLFHELNLIYDPSFTPPTNFGVITR